MPLQPPPAIHNVLAPPVPHVPATEVDLMHADSYVDSMVQANRSESLVSS